MKKFRSIVFGVSLAVLVGAAFAFTSFVPGGNIVPIPVNFQSITATASGVPVMKAAGSFRVKEFGVAARVINSGSLTVQLIRNGTDNVSTPVTVATGWTEGTVTAGNALLATNDNLSITLGGSTPDVDDVGIIMYLRKE